MGRRKKGGLGRLFGAITGSPYERLQKQIDKIIDDANSDKDLAKNLGNMIKLITQQYEEGNIDDEEHDLLVEEVEESDPKGRIFTKLTDDDDEFYGDDMPDSPDLKLGKTVNLDDLMASKGDSFTGSYGRDEFEEFRQKMTQDFIDEVDDSDFVQDNDRHLRMQNRAFADEDEDLKRMKQQFAKDSGLSNPSAAEEEEDEETHYYDEDGVEWWKDEDEQWWYRMPGVDDWEIYED